LYPAEAIAAILDGLDRRVVAADVGAGTGISSRCLADRGVRVLAIEPNRAMREAAEVHPLIEWREGTAEETGLAAGSVGLVQCAQAFHWIRQPEALREFARILIPRGRIAIVWNERDRSDALMTAYRDAIRMVGGEHPAEMREFDPGVIGRSGVFAPARLVEFAHHQRLDERGLIGRAMSASYAPKEGDRGTALVNRLRELFASFREGDERVTLRYRTRVWLSERV
jgi:SAM-dependent methyltransferase